MEQNPFERLAERMAELFVERFSSMVGSSSRRTVEAVYPQQNLEGSVFNGTNALIASNRRPFSSSARHSVTSRKDTQIFRYSIFIPPYT